MLARLRSGYELYVVGARERAGCRVTGRDGYACEGDAAYLRVPAPEFFATLAPLYARLRDAQLRRRLTFGPSWNVLAIHKANALKPLLLFVRAHAEFHRNYTEHSTVSARNHYGLHLRN